MLKSGLGLTNNIVLEPSILMILPFYINGFLEWIMHSTSDLVMRVVYLLYVTECVVQRTPFLMVFMDLSMMGMCHSFAQIFKIAGLMCYLK